MPELKQMNASSSAAAPEASFAGSKSEQPCWIIFSTSKGSISALVESSLSQTYSRGRGSRPGPKAKALSRFGTSAPSTKICVGLLRLNACASSYENGVRAKIMLSLWDQDSLLSYLGLVHGVECGHHTTGSQYAMYTHREVVLSRSNRQLSDFQVAGYC